MSILFAGLALVCLFINLYIREHQPAYINTRLNTLLFVAFVLWSATSFATAVIYDFPPIIEAFHEHIS